MKVINLLAGCGIFGANKRVGAQLLSTEPADDESAKATSTDDQRRVIDVKHVTEEGDALDQSRKEFVDKWDERIRRTRNA